MQSRQRFDSFQFNNERIRDQQVCSKAALESYCFVDNWNGNLPPIRNTAEIKFKAETFFIRVFEQPGTQCAVHVYRGANHGCRYRIVFVRQDTHANGTFRVELAKHNRFDSTTEEAENTENTEGAAFGYGEPLRLGTAGGVNDGNWEALRASSTERT